MRVKYNETMSYRSILNHLKHISQYRNDPRFSEIVNELSVLITKYGAIYSHIADELSLSKAGKAESTDNIVGFLVKGYDNRAVKYNRTTGDFVVYDYKTDDIDNIIALYKVSKRQYISKVKRQFKGELPENQ